MMSPFQGLRLIWLVLLGLLGATMGQVAASAERSDFVPSTLAAKWGGGSGSLTGIGREGIVDGLTGFTQQGNRVAAGLRNGDLNLNVIGDNLFEKAWTMRGGTGSAPQAFAYGEKLYLRSSSGTLGEGVIS